MRDRYPSTSKFAKRGVPNYVGERPLPTTPTDAEPGTDAKRVVLAERAARGESLFHPADALGSDEPTPWQVPGCRSVIYEPKATTTPGSRGFSG